MKIDLTSDPAFAKAVAEGVRAAFLDPEFRRALVNDVVAGFVWLTRKEVGEMLGGKTRQTVKEWAAKNKITVSTAMGKTEPLYLLQSVQEAMERGAIRAKKAPETVAKPYAAPAPRRGIQPVRTLGNLPSSR